MIGSLNLTATARNPKARRETLRVRAGSAATVALNGVPAGSGVEIASVAVRVVNPAGQAIDVAAVRGGAWAFDVPASHLAAPGTVEDGVLVYATGTGVSGERTWFVGAADLEVCPADGAVPSPGAVYCTLRLHEATPSAPARGDCYVSGGMLYLYDGAAWTVFATAATLGYRFARQAVVRDNYVVSVRDRRVNYLQVVGDVHSLTLVLPADAGDYVRDLIVDVENLTGHAVVAEFWNLDEDYRVVVPDGESLAEMTAFDDGSMARLYVTQTGFSGGGLPVFEVRRADVAMADDGYYYYDE